MSVQCSLIIVSRICVDIALEQPLPQRLLILEASVAVDCPAMRRPDRWRGHT